MKIRRFLSLLMTAVMIVSAISLISCQKEDEKPAVTTAQVEKDKFASISEYRIIAETSKESNNTAASYVAVKLNALSEGVNLEALACRKIEETEGQKEIVVGDTNRSGNDSVKAKLPISSEKVQGIISVAENGSIYINGNTKEALFTTVKKFVALVSEGGIESVKNDITVNVDPEVLFINGGALSTFKVDMTNTIYTPTPTKPAANITYGKVIVLEHNGDDNGTILVTCESLDLESYPVFKSTSNGLDFEKISDVRDSDRKFESDWQPAIYELPCDIGDYPEGTIIFGGCSRNSTSTKIVVYASRDIGKTWEQVSVVCRGNYGDAKDGVWEPFFYAEDGVLYCLYSDDHHPRCNQALALKYTSDLKKWSDQIEVVTPNNSDLRPGMITLAKMGNGKYIVVYEMVGIDNAAYYKTTTDLTDWDANSEGTRISSGGYTVGSAPFVAWTPAGGANGTLIVTGMFSIGGSSATGTDWLLSFDYGKTWNRVPNPLPYPKDKDNTRFAYSPGLFVAKDGSIYYVNDINWDYVEEANGRYRAKLAYAHITIE